MFVYMAIIDISAIDASSNQSLLFAIICGSWSFQNVYTCIKYFVKLYI